MPLPSSSAWLKYGEHARPYVNCISLPTDAGKTDVVFDAGPLGSMPAPGIAELLSKLYEAESTPRLPTSCHLGDVTLHQVASP